MKTDFYFHLDLVCTECIRGYGNWGYNDWNRWREEQGMLCRCLNFSIFADCVFKRWVKKYAANARCKIPLASQWYHNNNFISFSTHFHWHQQCWPGPRKTVGWTPILNAPTRTSTSRSTKTGQIPKFWFIRPSLTSSSATTVEANIRNNLNFKTTS